MRSIKRVRTLALAPAFAGILLLAACGSSSSSHSASSHPSMAGMNMNSSAHSTDNTTDNSAHHSTQHGDEPMYMGDGLAATDQGYTFAPAGASVAAPGFVFRILGPDGKPVTAFEPEQTKLMHFYLIRSDLSGFQHVHPTMAADGTWTAPTKAAGPGAYRVYAQFIAKGAGGEVVPLVLSEQVTSAGSAPDRPVPAAAASTTVDGYTVTVDSSQLMAGMAMPLKVSISKDGQPVTDLEPYLATYAHLSGFHAGDLAMAHLHPRGGVATTATGGPDLTFEATLPEAGQWRMYLQFQTGGTLHTAAVTLDVR
ncbi:hypothetical protein KGQ19_38520 [Catenulispora sp. NL8]|uniref:YtkA-like domain-containing protein n=1 Tax=Catenulispora pinistramenti TaxID=2705254 RepID=A0ABS5L383_9ACTN|nr:hypothetical protein [Catenulispora pinistramenti]MBS2552766.1 hypothetical protein [Catenulispora pinistramenti]